MKEGFRFGLALERKRQFQNCLASTPVINGEGAISEPYVRFMQLVARGYYFSEFLIRPNEAWIITASIRNAGVEFPKTNEWDIPVTLRRIIRVMDGASSLGQIQKRLKLDISQPVIKDHIKKIGKSSWGENIQVSDFSAGSSK